MAKVILKNVKKVFNGNITAVNKFNLEVSEGEFIVLVGPSGCGKSTALRLIAGLEEPTEGEIYIGNRLINNVPPKDRDIAMVFQNYALYPHMTVYENMAFGLKLRKYTRKAIDKRVKEAADILGISDLFDRRPKELSGGQRQRVAVGRAIVRKPEVFLFDEPLSNLDAKLRVQMRAELSKLHSRLKATMVYVTHDQVEAMTMGQRIVVLKDGVVQQIGQPLRLYEEPVNKFVAGFIGSPSMNFVDVTLNETDKGLVLENKSLRIKIPPEHKRYLLGYIGKELTFGIRPEDIHYADSVKDIVHKAEVHAQVEVIEPMGSEVFLYLNTGESSFVAKVGTRAIPQVGQRIKLVFDLNRAHLFDKDTEERILPSLNRERLPIS